MPRRRSTSKVTVAPINMQPLSLRFTEPQLMALRREVKKTGLHMTEIIRRAVDFYIEKKAA